MNPSDNSQLEPVRSVELPPRRGGGGGRDLVLNGQVFPYFLTPDMTFEDLGDGLYVLRLGIYVETDPMAEWTNF